MMDVMEYFAAVEARLALVPPLSAEDVVFLEQVEQALLGGPPVVCPLERRYCKDCPADITHRSPNAMRCTHCADLSKLDSKRRYESTKGNLKRRERRQRKLEAVA